VPLQISTGIADVQMTGRTVRYKSNETAAEW